MTAQQRLQQLAMLNREIAAFFEQAMSNGRYQEAAKHAAEICAQMTEVAAHFRGTNVVRIERGEVVMEEPREGKEPKPERYWDGVDVAAWEIIAEGLARLPEPDSRFFNIGKRPEPGQQYQRPQ